MCTALWTSSWIALDETIDLFTMFTSITIAIVPIISYTAALRTSCGAPLAPSCSEGMPPIRNFRSPDNQECGLNFLLFSLYRYFFFLYLSYPLSYNLSIPI